MPEKITILINQKPYHVAKPEMTGRELKELAAGPLQYLLVLVVGKPDEVAGGDDKIINDDQAVSLESGMRFRIVNPATFGAAAITAPPLLHQHVEQLQGLGYNVELAQDGVQVCVVLKDYPLPASVWNRKTTDIMIIVHPAYPNSKLDMFYTSTGLRLSDGRVPKAGDVEEPHGGRTWQRFSWHVAAWNPAHDSILTYLDVIDHRLGMRE